MKNEFTTRMHSSRMRTGHLLTVCQSQLPGGGGVWEWGVCSCGVSAPGGCLLPGGSAVEGGVCSGGVSAGESAVGGGGVWSQDTLRQRPPPLWTESQMPVKTLPWPNFVAAGNNQSSWNYCSIARFFIHVSCNNKTLLFKVKLMKHYVN